jgi:transcriptional regulator with XRE-family HTH domain
MPPNLRNVPKKLGEAVRELRLKQRLTQMALAEKSGLTLNYLGEVERGESLASVETVAKIGRGLGITGADLLKHAGL